MLEIMGVENTCLNNLAIPEKLSCLKAMAYISKIDDHIDGHEAYIVALLAKKMGLTDSRAFLQNLDENEILRSLSAITDRQAALELIKFLCFIGNADSDLKDSEILFIGQAANAMGIEISKAEKINDWVVDGFILEENARQIFEKGTAL